jgi:hypothetical protein
MGFWSRFITEGPIVSDAAENLRLTLNLERNGVLSMSTTAPVQPSMYREPLPAFFGQFAVRARGGDLMAFTNAAGRPKTGIPVVDSAGD